MDTTPTTTTHTQSHTDLYFVSPDSPTAQLGLNQEQIRELLEEQERYDREFQQKLEEEERARLSTQHQDKARWVLTPFISDSEPAQPACKALYEPPINTTSHGDDLINHRDTPNPTTRHQLPTPIAHLELKQNTYEGYGTAYEPHIAAMSYDNDVSNHRIHHKAGTNSNP